MTIDCCDTCGEPLDPDHVYQVTKGIIEDGDFVENGERTYHHEGCV